MVETQTIWAASTLSWVVTVFHQTIGLVSCLGWHKRDNQRVYLTPFNAVVMEVATSLECRNLGMCNWHPCFALPFILFRKMNLICKLINSRARIINRLIGWLIDYKNISDDRLSKIIIDYFLLSSNQQKLMFVGK